MTERHPLADTADRLNQTIAKVERWLTGKGFGVAACVEIGDDYDLRFEKVAGVFRLTVDSQPLANASRQQRGLAMKAIPDLLAALEAEADLQRDGLLKVIEDIERFMEEHP